LHEADRAFGACWRRGNALWGVPVGKGVFHAVGAAAYAGRWAARRGRKAVHIARLRAGMLSRSSMKRRVQASALPGPA